MTYTEAFTSVRNAFILDPDYELDEKLVLIWLASKPADWIVKQDVVQAELGIGRDRATRILRNLRAKGAITKPAPEQQKDGTWRRAPSELIPGMRDAIRHVSPGRTEPLGTKGSVTEGSVSRGIYKGVSTKLTPNGDETSESQASESPGYLVTPDVNRATGEVRAVCTCGSKAPWHSADETGAFLADVNDHEQWHASHAPIAA